jgi:ABC-type microcin C transport system permease subunit YejB
VKVIPEGYEGITYQLTVEVNHRRRELADPRVRRAIAHAIDRDFVVDTIFLGYAKASAGPIPKFDTQFHTADLPVPAFDVRRANALLDEAGFARGANGTRFQLRLLPAPWFEQTRQIGDYLRHIALPILSMVLGAFATSTLLTKNSFLDEIRKQYVLTARMKGLSETQVLYGHVFRNAMLIVIAGFPGAFVHAFFTGSLLIETVFSLDGLGLLSFESIVNRDYAVVFATLYIFSLIGLVVNLLSDLTYTWIDPRIDFETREV